MPEFQMGDRVRFALKNPAYIGRAGQVVDSWFDDPEADEGGVWRYWVRMENGHEEGFAGFELAREGESL